MEGEMTILPYVGALMLVVWGFAHIVPARGIVAGFGALSPDNRRILTMEWVAEGLALIFIGVMAGLVWRQGGPTDRIAILVVRACGAMALIMAAWTAATGGRTKIIPIKICPLVKTAAAACLILPTLVR
jgi:hypothetical protein